MKGPVEKTRERPAETGAIGAGAVAAALIAWLEPSPQVSAIITAGVGTAAAVFTYLNTHGGIFGVFRRLLRGDG